ncbi:MAG: hypothetical protein C7B43_21305 [Sulfobacillus benefaciens]|jgi:hypothetical protein|uniref:Uncharacterized protein n=1 Tax=Sulfobacillus benefaciens TaxID=453960 RepID=A0A2T2WGR4_9FIRM|nr:MAG: hypothetical protein C7B43_21305 [Sulfobacillus benefaciens]HBQ94123.1 hypothetical protein [Sulfobacillus sp.]
MVLDGLIKALCLLNQITLSAPLSLNQGQRVMMDVPAGKARGGMIPVRVLRSTPANRAPVEAVIRGVMNKETARINLDTGCYALVSALKADTEIVSHINRRWHGELSVRTTAGKRS